MKNSPRRVPPPRRAFALSLSVLALALIAGAAVALEAANEGVLLPGTQPVTGGLEGFPTFADDGGAPGTFDNPSSCQGCHGNYRQFGEPIYEPWNSWAGSLMANAGRDPLFWATVDIANQDDALELGDVGIGDFCFRCHAPKAFYEGRSRCETSYGEFYDGACFEGTPDTRDNDFEGISCHYCHRQYDASIPPVGDFFDENAPYDRNGKIYLSTARDVMRGPFDDAVPPGHGFALSELHKSAAFCGQCHNVTNPYKNRRDPETGADLGVEMPLDLLYDEWKQSDFGRPERPEFASCQQCHMPTPDLDGDGDPDAAFACSTPPGLRGEATELDGPIRSHFFRGTNTFMLELLKGEYGRDLRREDEFDANIAEARRFLQEETLDVDVSLPELLAPGASFEAQVRVTNRAGHKFPSGYAEGRRAFMTVRAGEDVDQDGLLDDEEVTFVSGEYDASSATLIEDAQAKVWEIKPGRYDFNGTGSCDLIDGTSGNKMFNMMLVDCISFDNRIPPQGFTPSPNTAPVNYTYPENPTRPGTLANWDVATYTIPVPASAFRPFLVDAQVYFQTVTRDFIEFLERENQSTCDPFDADCDPTAEDPRPNRGQKMRVLWQRYGRSLPEPVEGALGAAPLDALPPGAGEASGAAGEPLLAAGYDDATGALSFTYAPACDASNHALYWGPLEQVGSYAYEQARCSIGTSGSSVFEPGPGSVFFLVVGHVGGDEGSYGVDAAGFERPEDFNVCALPQSFDQVCE